MTFFSFFNRIEITPHPNKFGSGAEKATFEHLAPEVKRLKTFKQSQ